MAHKDPILVKARQVQKKFLQLVKSGSRSLEQEFKQAPERTIMQREKRTPSSHNVITQKGTEKAKKKIQMANTLVKASSYKEAIGLLQDALKLYPSNFEAFQLLADIYELSDDYVKAVEYLSRILILDPNDEITKERLLKIRTKCRKLKIRLPKPRKPKIGSIELCAEKPKYDKTLYPRRAHIIRPTGKSKNDG